MIPRYESRPTLLLVDDAPINLQVLHHTLHEDYRLLFAKSGQAALDLVCSDRPDLILLDIMMPGLSGYEVCKRLKQQADTASIPVIFVTALADAANEQQGLELGAVDYITKPFNPHIVRARVRTHLSLVHTRELEESRLRIVQCLGAAAEHKDNETGMHVVRMSHYAQVLALAVGYSEQAAKELLHAAPLHDVGKIGTPDAILRKSGKLTEAEWDVMRQHTLIGERIIGEHPSGVLRLAATIARHHHERWDGSGYPDGLAGEAIPHAARIVAVADVFDALTSVRPYKRAWSFDEARAYILAEKGKHLDAELVALFVDCLPEIMDISKRWGDESHTPLLAAVEE